MVAGMNTRRLTEEQWMRIRIRDEYKDKIKELKQRVKILEAENLLLKLMEKPPYVFQQLPYVTYPQIFPMPATCFFDDNTGGE